MNEAAIDIVIVNFNTGALLRECIGSIGSVAHEVPIGCVVVVDNASCDGSATNLPTLPVPVVVVANRENVGFARACNQGARACVAPYILFLNPDTRLYPESLATPVRFLERSENSDVGIVGVQLVDESGNVARTCSRFPTPANIVVGMVGLDRVFPSVLKGHFMRDWNHASTRVVDQLIGAFFLTRRHLFDELGGFDERFFVYYEEVDYSARARNAGWSSVYLSEARAFHLGGGSSRAVKARRLFYSLRSRSLYAMKHFGALSGTTLLAATLAVEPFARAAIAIGRRSPQELIELGKAMCWLWGEVPEILLTPSEVRL